MPGNTFQFSAQQLAATLTWSQCFAKRQQLSDRQTDNLLPRAMGKMGGRESPIRFRLSLRQCNAAYEWYYWVCVCVLGSAFLCQIYSQRNILYVWSLRIYLPGIETPFRVWAFVFISPPPSWQALFGNKLARNMLKVFSASTPWKFEFAYLVWAEQKVLFFHFFFFNEKSTSKCRNKSVKKVGVEILVHFGQINATTNKRSMVKIFLI